MSSSIQRQGTLRSACALAVTYQRIPCSHYKMYREWGICTENSENWSMLMRRMAFTYMPEDFPVSTQCRKDMVSTSVRRRRIVILTLFCRWFLFSWRWSNNINGLIIIIYNENKNTQNQQNYITNKLVYIHYIMAPLVWISLIHISHVTRNPHSGYMLTTHKLPGPVRAYVRDSFFSYLKRHLV